FFLAEDGIRDFHMTGVQTCALPIFERGSMELVQGDTMIRETPIAFEGELSGLFGIVSESPQSESAPVCAVLLNGGALRHVGPNRSEERRVGKVCASGSSSRATDETR